MPSLRTRLMTLTSVLLLLGLALSGCTGDQASGDSGLPDTARLRLHPHGDPGRWLDAGYRQGFGSAYVTMNDLCAVTRELAIEVESNSAGEPTVLARNLAGGARNWELEGATCSRGALLRGDPQAPVAAARTTHLVVRTADEGWKLIEPTAGVARMTLPLGENVTAVEPLTWVGSVLVVETDGSTLLGIENGTQVWSRAVPSRAEVTVLDNGMAGVTDFAGGTVSVVDLKTGKTRHTASVPKPHWITWASDGYVQKVQETDPEYAFFDLDGHEVDRTKGVSQYRFVPDPGSGVTFPLKDHRRAGRVVGVDARGVPQLFEDDRQRDYTRSGQVEELPDSIISLQGVGSGGLLLFPRKEDGVTVIDQDGDEVAAWPLDYRELWIESGHIVLSGDFGTSVLLPDRV